ncbi:MAG TPA: amylo-alpha-1,6-glucosidase [Candidatus Bathyarchaeia archaeon]|nr:amylo-alpha-1,6-glucosidase [Candidatus Bathyarchaeia archaeon]
MSSLPTMKIGSNVLSDTNRALKTEWLVTNGLGGYASSTILGVNTRKYHGLLVAALNPPVDRWVLLTKLDEEIQFGNNRFSFGANETTLGLQPANSVFPDEFSLGPLPTCTFSVDKRFRLKKTVFMPRERNASIIAYEVANTSGETVRVSLSPLINCRGFHSVTTRSLLRWNVRQENSNQLLMAQPSTNASTLLLFSPEGQFNAEPSGWVENFYRAEAERGESSVDDNFRPGAFGLDVASDETRKLSVLAVGGKDERDAENTLWTIYKDEGSIDAVYESELKRKRDLLSDFQKYHNDLDIEGWLKWLILAADAFIVKRELTRTKSVIAGYHWFADWGRDSLISLPGLTLTLGRFEDARQVLQTFSLYCREGLIPNSFPDDPQRVPAYNTVDATLWYFNAILQYLKYTSDFQFVQQAFWPTLESIIDHHVKGTLFGIHVDTDGLLEHDAQLTWMDAAPDGRPVTPRSGKAVEVQALWYNALRIMQILSDRFGQDDKVEIYGRMAEKAQKSFLEKFWHPQMSNLFDVVSASGKDNSLRPNQVLAASLDFTMLDKVKAELIVESVWRQLLTPFGLRTLSSSDPRYAGRYHGDRRKRDMAYHNGTVWPWLLGPFVTALLRLRGHDAHWRNIAFENFLKPLFTVELQRAGLGSISEVFDGDSPHDPRGCIAQAWSVAEPLRAYMEDILLKRPPYEQQIMKSNKV